MIFTVRMVKTKQTNAFPVEDIMRHKPVIFMNDENISFKQEIRGSNDTTHLH